MGAITEDFKSGYKILSVLGVPIAWTAKKSNQTEGTMMATA